MRETRFKAPIDTQSIAVECLDHFVIFGEKHLNYLVAEWVRFFLVHRPHQGVGNVPLAERPAPPDDVPRRSQVRRRTFLGRHLKTFERRAA